MNEARLHLVLRSADAAVVFAQDVRQAHRKRSPKGSKARETDLRIALQRLKRTMEPIRSELARLHNAGDRGSQFTALREASESIQRERRKLWKMQKRPKVRKESKRAKSA